MRFFTDKSGNFNWAAIGGICAAIGSVLAVVTFFSGSSGSSATDVNKQTVLGDTFTGDKIVGISIEDYEAGLKRREAEVIARLEDKSLPVTEAEMLRQALKRIDTRQASLESSYADVSKLTADIRAYHENSETPELVDEAITALFDGDTANAARLSIKAGIPVKSVGTIDSLERVYQPIETEADFLRYVAGQDLILSNDKFYKAVVGRNGSLNGYWAGNRVLSGSWAWIDGKYCREYSWNGDHYPEHCAKIFATISSVSSVSSVKFEDSGGKVQVYSKE